MLFPTTLVGSYPQPEWLIDRKKLAARFPPRVRARELWRIPGPLLEEAQNDATVLAIRAQEEAGLDIITDGETRRESYSNRFATALEGVDTDNPGQGLDRSGNPTMLPRILGKIRRKHAVEVDDLKFLKKHTKNLVKITVPGPFTMSEQAKNEFYKSGAEAAMDYAIAVNAEIKDLFAAGADVVQIDEPYMQARPEKAREYGIAALNRTAASPPDGLTIQIVNGTGAALSQLLEISSVRYDVLQLTHLGTVSASPWMWMVGPNSPIKTPADLAGMKLRMPCSTARWRNGRCGFVKAPLRTSR